MQIVLGWAAKGGCVVELVEQDTQEAPRGYQGVQDELRHQVIPYADALASRQRPA
jgi:hypothetical protein